MRIIGGRARGRTLQVPPGRAVRPTTNKVREALFNVLHHRFDDPVDGARVLDLFAGAGTLGLEALSRGAAEVVFVERDRRHGKVLAANLAKLQPAVDGTGRLVLRAVESFLERAPRPFDLVFLDPPYADELVGPTVSRLASGGWLGESALVCVEHPVGAVPTAPPGLVEAFARSYGSSAVTVLRLVSGDG